VSLAVGAVETDPDAQPPVILQAANPLRIEQTAMREDVDPIAQVVRKVEDVEDPFVEEWLAPGDRDVPVVALVRGTQHGADVIVRDLGRIFPVEVEAVPATKVAGIGQIDVESHRFPGVSRVIRD